jgi:hypothetical protein
MQIRVRPLLGAAAVWSAGVGGTAIAAGPRTARLLVDEFDPTSFKRGPASGKNGSTMTIEAALCLLHQVVNLCLFLRSAAAQWPTRTTSKSTRGTGRQPSEQCCAKQGNLQGKSRFALPFRDRAAESIIEYMDLPVNSLLDENREFVADNREICSGQQGIDRPPNRKKPVH